MKYNNSDYRVEQRRGINAPSSATYIPLLAPPTGTTRLSACNNNRRQQLRLLAYRFNFLTQNNLESRQSDGCICLF
jgi:hypothetical protein